MTNEILSKGNITTIATWIAIGITMLIAYFGIEFDATPFIPVLSGLITLGIAIYSSKHPNTLGFLGNDENDASAQVDADELVQSIQDLIEKYDANSTIEVEVEEDVVDGDVC